MNVLRRGTRGEAVRDVQARLASLGYSVDPNEHGEFGPSTEGAVRAFQQRRHLLVDGTIGEHTWDELVEAGYALGDRVLYLRVPYLRGDDIRALQAGLNMLGFDAGKEDGILGERTDRALREFQKNVGLPLDGIVGRTTIDAIARLRPIGPGPGRAAVREGEALLQLSTHLNGARIALEAGHGFAGSGPTGPTGLAEGLASELVAQALAAELRMRGATPLNIWAERAGTPSDRARLANQQNADILISLHLNAHDDPSAEGACTFYYGRDDWVSPAGHRLADLIQEALTTRLGLRDGRTHPMSLPLLRETRMPAVHVEPCFITNPREEALLRDPSFHEGLARAMADAIAAYFSPSDGFRPA